RGEPGPSGQFLSVREVRAGDAMKGAAAVLVAVSCTACGQSQQSQQGPLTIHEQRQTVLNGIADKCGLDRSTFKLIGDDELHVQPRPNAHYESVDCALSELRNAKLPVKMGFVGNEYY